MSPHRRRHEMALFILFLIVALLVGFWFGRMSAPDSTLAYERGRAAGQRTERQRGEQNRIETNILSEEVAAARTRKSEPKSVGSTDAVDQSHSGASGGGAGANNH